MHRPMTAFTSAAPMLVALGSLLIGTSACAAPDEPAPINATVFEGARVITGDGGTLEDAVFVVENDRLTNIGTSEDVAVPGGATRVDLSGKTVIPAIVNAHVHLAKEREDRTRQLQHMAYYGAGLVVSLGHDEGETGLAMRSEMVPDGARSLSAGRGITTPEPGRSEVPFWVTSQDEARSAVRDLAAQDVDIVKIWVDDRGGRYEKLLEPLYTAIIDEAHGHGLRVTAHVFTLEDAKGLLRAGVDAFAHGVRDQDVDDELLALWQERPDVVLVPNLPNPGVVADLSWLSDAVPADRLAEMAAGSTDDPGAQESFGIQARNLDRLNQAGVTIAFGTDGSTPWAVHLEMEDMVRSGMTPRDVIVAATRNSAVLMGVADTGVLAPGMRADFIVLGANPLDDITHTRMIDAMYLRGVAMDRDALGARLLEEAAESP